MALFHPPQVGTIVKCDFPSCFSPPEMVKNRAVIVINVKIPGREHMLTVVPISNTPPSPEFAHHCLLPDRLLPHYMKDGQGRWVKGDMVYTLSTSRMSPITRRDASSGKRVYEYPRLDLEHLRKVRACVASALGIGPELFSD